MNRANEHPAEAGTEASADIPGPGLDTAPPQLLQASRASRLASAFAGVLISIGLLGSVVLGLTSPNGGPGVAGPVADPDSDNGNA